MRARVLEDFGAREVEKRAPHRRMRAHGAQSTGPCPAQNPHDDRLEVVIARMRGDDRRSVLTSDTVQEFPTCRPKRGFGRAAQGSGGAPRDQSEPPSFRPRRHVRDRHRRMIPSDVIKGGDDREFGGARERLCRGVHQHHRVHASGDGQHDWLTVAIEGTDRGANALNVRDRETSRACGIGSGC